MIIFVTGGARSGKSDFKQDMAEKIERKTAISGQDNTGLGKFNS